MDAEGFWMFCPRFQWMDVYLLKWVFDVKSLFSAFLCVLCVLCDSDKKVGGFHRVGSFWSTFRFYTKYTTLFIVVFFAFWDYIFIILKSDCCLNADGEKHGEGFVTVNGYL